MSKKDGKVVAVYAPAYCLFIDGSRLTHMNAMCVRDALYFYRSGQVSIVIFGCAYRYWQKEALLKRQAAEQSGVPADGFVFLEEVTDRYDEVRRLKIKLAELGAGVLIFVGEGYHLGKQFRKSLVQALPDIRVEFISVACQHFEPTLEPRWIKQLRVRYKPLWRLWNWLVELLTPVYLRYWPL